MEQQFYYQQNRHNNHLPQDVSQQQQQQQYYQLNGSVSQTHQSLPSNQMPNQSYFGNQSIGGSVPPQQHYGQQMTSATPQKSSTQLNANYPQMSATHPPQQQSLQTQRTPQQLSATHSQQPVSQQMNVLSEQMSNISFSGSQQRPHIQSPPQSANGPQPTQQPISTLGSIPPYSVAPPQQRPVVAPQTNVMPTQRTPQPPMDSVGHQNWSNPSFSALPGGQSTPIPDKWNSGAIQSNVSTAPPVMPPMSPQFGQTQQQPQQANRYMPSYPPQRPLQATQQMPPQMSGQMPPQMSGQMPPQMSGQMPPQMSGQMPPPMSGQMPSHGPPMTATQQRYGPQTTPNQLPQPNYGLGSNQLNAQQTQQRLDPEAMPSVVQVIEEDKSKYDNNDNVLFTTSIPASVPPLVTTIAQNEYSVTNDGGCARPNHLRSTLYQVPISEDTLKTTNIPLAIVVQPFDDSEVEGKIVVPVSNSEILRCNRCKAYMNPYMRFIDGGRRFQCSLCHHLSEVTPSYFANLDHTGQRLDKFNRPELYLGSYEFRATDEYCRNGVLNARRPHIIFACELTATSKPILHHLSKNLSDIIQNLPRDPLNFDSPPPLIGFLTYNSKIQIYDIVNNGHSHIISDVASTFPPLTTFLVDPLTHSEQIESFLQSLPTLYFDEELEIQTVLGPVIEAALLTCQVDARNWIPGINSDSNNPSQQPSIPVGKVYVFHCTLPNFGTDADTPGRLKPRWTTSPDEIRKLLGTDKEKTILSPDSNKYYIGLGQRCVTDFASGVELFLFPPMNGSYLDVATLGELVRLTGTGAIYKYFNDFSDRFLIDLKYSLRSSFAFDAIMKVRTSTGIRPHEYIGNFYSRTTSDIECAAVNTGCNIAVELKYDDKLPEDEFVVIQVALLYTSLCGERRVRVHNIALSTCQQVADVYRNACCDTTVNVLVRQVVSALRMGEKTVQQTKESLITRAISILTAYRRHCAQPGSSLGQLILPEALKLLPMYICGFLKCDAVDGGPEMTPDDKAYAQIKFIGASLSLSQVILYPRLLKIEYEDQSGQTSSLKSTQIRCSSHKLMSSSALAYLLENGFYILLYIPNNIIPTQTQFFNAVFGSNIDSISKIQPELGLPKLLTNESQFLNKIIGNIENERKKSMRIYIIRQGIDKLEAIFRGFLYEDKKAITNAVGGDSAKLEGPSYVDLLCHLHKEIRAQLN